MRVVYGPFLDISFTQFYQRVLLLHIRQRNTHTEEEEDISGDRRWLNWFCDPNCCYYYYYYIIKVTNLLSLTFIWKFCNYWYNSSLSGPMNEWLNSKFTNTSQTENELNRVATAWLGWRFCDAIQLVTETELAGETSLIVLNRDSEPNEIAM